MSAVESRPVVHVGEEPLMSPFESENEAGGYVVHKTPTISSIRIGFRAKGDYAIAYATHADAEESLHLHDGTDIRFHSKEKLVAACRRRAEIEGRRSSRVLIINAAGLILEEWWA